MKFGTAARILHWVMAIAIVAMMFLGAGLVGSLAHYPVLLTIHRTVGLTILLLAVIRVINRRIHPPPQWLDSMGPVERRMAGWSEKAMYALFLLQPIVGWTMASASGIPVRILGGFVVPAIAPVDAGLYSVLRTTHAVLAYALLAAFTAHISAVVFHTVALRDGLLKRMTFGR